MTKQVNSIDGFFNEKIKVVNFKNSKNDFDKYNTIIGKGNSISQLPFLKKTKSIIKIDENSFFIDKKIKY